MLRVLGLTFVSSETVIWVTVFIACISVLFGFFTDAVAGKTAFGVVGNSLLIFGGTLGAMVGWNLHVNPILNTEVDTVILVCVGGGLGTVLLFTIFRRVLAAL